MSSSGHHMLDADQPAVQYGELNPLHAAVLRDAVAAEDERAMARIVRGSRARTASPFFDELSAAMQLSPDTGANWAALEDVVRDIVIYGQGSLVIIVTEAEQFLAEDEAIVFLTVLDIFTSVDRESHERGGGRARLLLTESPGGVSRIRERVESSGLPVAYSAFSV